MGKHNVTSGSWTPFQVGRVVDSDEQAEKPAKKSAAEKGGGSVTNVRSGNARVGLQADEVHGDLHIRMPRR